MKESYTMPISSLMFFKPLGQDDPLGHVMSFGPTCHGFRA